MGKGEETRERIVERAMALCSREGFEGLSFSELASDLKLSKSGLFAHFGSKEDLELSVLQHAAERFTEEVVRPALKSPRGEPRLRALFENWLAWTLGSDLPGGCVLLAAAAEFDDKSCPQRQMVEKSLRALLEALTRCVSLGVEEGHFRKDLDARQMAHEIHALVIGFHQLGRLYRDRSQSARARVLFDRLVADARASH